MTNKQLSAETRLDWIGFRIMIAAAIAACFWPMAGLPIGIVGAVVFLVGSRRASRG